MKIAYEHLKRLIDLKGEHIAVREFRGLALTTSVVPQVQLKLRGAISQASTLAEIEELLQLKHRNTEKQGPYSPIRCEVLYYF